MKYNVLLIIAIIGIYGAGCWSKETKAQKDCSKAQNPYTCHLDQALESKDPSYCAYVSASRHALCLSAYSEITGEKIECKDLKPGSLQNSCFDYAPEGEIMPPELIIQPTTE